MIGKLLLATTLAVGAGSVEAGVILSEDFDDISTLGAAGWSQINNSTAGGSTGWFQGNTGVFTASSGADDAYIAANFLNAGFGGNISNWLLTPTLALSERMFVSFDTRSSGFVPDRLEVRLSVNGASGNVGATDSSVGDFTTVLGTINASLGFDFPTDWTQFSFYLGSIASGTTGRIAFRYAVTDTFLNADYIGIDSVRVTVPEPSSAGLFALALLGLGAVRRTRVRR